MGVNGSSSRGTGGKRRAYYPSGPWIDAEGRPTTSPYASTPTQTTQPQQTGNPNPDNYKIVRASEVGSALVVEIKYHDCTNYEGNKVGIGVTAPRKISVDRKEVYERKKKEQ